MIENDILNMWHGDFRWRDSQSQLRTETSNDYDQLILGRLFRPLAKYLHGDEIQGPLEEKGFKWSFLLDPARFLVQL